MPPPALRRLLSPFSRDRKRISGERVDISPHPVAPVSSTIMSTMEHRRQLARAHEEASLHSASRHNFERYVKPDACFEAVGDGRVVLVSLNWLVEYALTGRSLPRRQDLPPEAIVGRASLARIYDAAEVEIRACVLPIVSISYCWYTKEHPDPDGEQLRRIAVILKREFHHQYKYKFDDMAVFMDWVSLYQSKGGPPRTAEQEQTFRRALSSMDLWYAHQGIVTLLVTSAPTGAPSARSYAERGWTNFERCCAELCKPQAPYALRPDAVWLGDGEELWNLIIDSSHSAEDEVRGRQLPRTPTMFNELLASKHFTNGADREEVQALYARTAHALLSGVKELTLSRIPWTNGLADAQQVAAVLGLSSQLTKLDLDCAHRAAASLACVLTTTRLSGLAMLSLEECNLDAAAAAVIAGALNEPGLPSLKELHLPSNSIDNAVALFRTLGAGTAPLLETLNLAENNLDEADGVALADAIGSGALAELRMLEVSDNPMGKRAAVALFSVLAHGRSARLRKLLMGNVDATSDGAAALAALLRSGVLGDLQCLSFGENEIGARGMEALATAMSEEPPTRLQEIELPRNDVGDDGLVALAATLRSDALPALEKLDLEENDLSDDGILSLAAALRACRRQRPAAIEELILGRNEGIGPASTAAIGKTMACGALPRLRVLHMGDERSDHQPAAAGHTNRGAPGHGHTSGRLTPKAPTRAHTVPSCV